MRKTLYMHPDAIRELYRIPRGVAGELTKVIRLLEVDPTPANSTPAPGRPGRHYLTALGYIVEYEIEEEKLTILVIEKE